MTKVFCWLIAHRISKRGQFIGTHRERFLALDEAIDRGVRLKATKHDNGMAEYLGVVVIQYEVDIETGQVKTEIFE